MAAAAAAEVTSADADVETQRLRDVYNMPMLYLSGIAIRDGIFSALREVCGMTDTQANTLFHNLPGGAMPWELDVVNRYNACIATVAPAQRVPFYRAVLLAALHASGGSRVGVLAFDALATRSQRDAPVEAGVFWRDVVFHYPYVAGRVVCAHDDGLLGEKSDLAAIFAGASRQTVLAHMPDVFMRLVMRGTLRKVTVAEFCAVLTTAANAHEFLQWIPADTCDVPVIEASGTTLAGPGRVTLEGALRHHSSPPVFPAYIAARDRVRHYRAALVPTVTSALSGLLLPELCALVCSFIVPSPA